LDFQVGPDGIVWTDAAKDRGFRLPKLRSYDGEDWTIRRNRVYDFEVTTDGTVWVQWAEPWQLVLTTAAFGPDDWRPPRPDIVSSSDEYDDVLLTEAGPIVWADLRDELVAGGSMPRVWARPKGPPALEVAADGLVWAIVDDSLIRLEDGDRRSWTTGSHPPFAYLNDHARGVAPDGSL
jgi:hypothetical protein